MRESEVGQTNYCSEGCSKYRFSKGEEPPSVL